MDRWFILLGSLAGFAGVALGAFGSHGLKGRVSPELLAVYQTGVLYQLIHALALVLVGVIAHGLADSSLVKAAGGLFLAGILVFSGSLYLLVLLDARWLGMVTPLGGLAFLAGWLCLAAGAWWGLRP